MHRRVDGAFALLGIEHLRDRDIRALSGGQRQMVAIASVCAMGPDVFVLDEPTASLDVGAMLQLAEAVARLKAAGKTVLVAEHRLWWLAGIADRVVVMRGGRAAATAPPRRARAPPTRPPRSTRPASRRATAATRPCCAGRACGWTPGR